MNHIYPEPSADTAEESLISPLTQVPYYGDTGLNAGVMHMDLNRFVLGLVCFLSASSLLPRMRSLPDGWTGAALAMHDKYKARIKLADQDILNILFR